MAKATGATVVTTLADMAGNETFDASNLGSAEEVRGPLHVDGLLYNLLCHKHNSRPAPAYDCAAVSCDSRHALALLPGSVTDHRVK